MKTTKILTVCAAMFLTLSAFSSNTGISRKFENKKSENFTYKTFESIKLSDSRIAEMVGSIISSPEILIQTQKQEGVVYVEYHIENDGSVVVDQLNTNNVLLGESVKMQIENLNFPISVSSNKKYYAKFNFKKQ